MTARRTIRLIAGSATALVASGLLAACGSDSAASRPEVEVVTVTVAPSVASEPTATADTSAVNAGSVTRGVVPDVVGVNHQLAQDTMQAAGF
ncbi:hypothetical protein [Cryptosporangium sp. NPDC048952]|uniref:hypothetical protein n=1 Tax=Cryptosporangium sp. NPDC048952 TaxID=3363961 RepID=UPI003713ECC9